MMRAPAPASSPTRPPSALAPLSSASSCAMRRERRVHLRRSDPLRLLHDLLRGPLVGTGRDERLERLLRRHRGEQVVRVVDLAQVAPERTGEADRVLALCEQLLDEVQERTRVAARPCIAEAPDLLVGDLRRELLHHRDRDGILARVDRDPLDVGAQPREIVAVELAYAARVVGVDAAAQLDEALHRSAVAARTGGWRTAPSTHDAQLPRACRGRGTRSGAAWRRPCAAGCCDASLSASSSSTTSASGLLEVGEHPRHVVGRPVVRAR